MTAVIRAATALFAQAEVAVTRRADGSLVLHSPQPLRAYPRCLNEHLVHWARQAPERPFLLERSKAGDWNGVTYAEALSEVRRIAGWLIASGMPADRPIALFSDNSVTHALLALAAMHVGIPAMPISSAYSRISRDFAKLRAIVQRTSPTLIYVEDHSSFAPALNAISDLHDAQIVVGGGSESPPGAIRFGGLRADHARAAAERAFQDVKLDTIAKILFTSGSTDEPKGVINTQRMLCSNQQAKAQVWPFLETTPPVVVDWLPWNHTFGGNHNFNLVLRNGGTLYIDAGRPVPALFPQTLANLREISPTIYFNVARGYELLIPALQADATLRRNFFRRLQLIYYAAASLPPNLWEALRDLALRTTGEAIPVVSGWGSTETSPLATDCHYLADRAGVIGLPIPGGELKLVPEGNKLEVRVRGPHVSPGYWGRPDLTARHFDSEGFYLIGDAVRFVDDKVPERGLLFDGRVSEDFKLTTGTWVNVGMLRIRAIAALAPVAQDIVIAGHDRSEVCFLIFPNIAACRSLLPEFRADVAADELLAHPGIRAHILKGLLELRRQGPGSSTHAARALLLAEPPSIDAGEITDKAYINQRAVLTRRKEHVDALYQLGHEALITLPS